MGLSDALFGKKYKNTSSYDYVAPDYSFYEQFAPTLAQQALTAPEVNLQVGGYTPYGKIMGVSDTGKGYLDYDLREVLDPTYNVLGRDFEGETWQAPTYALTATGRLTGGPDIASAMIEKGGLLSASELDDTTKQWLKLQDYMTETENLGEERSAYYTPYELVAGLHTGRGSDIGFDPTNGFDYSGQTKTVGKRHNQTHYFDPNWEAVRRYTLDDTGPLLKASLAMDPTLQDTEGWDWIDNTLYDPDYGYFTDVAPGTDQFDYTRNSDSKTQSYRKGGIAGPLGTVLSFIPGLQPIGMALSAANAIANKNPLGAALAFLPMGLDKLGVTSGLTNTFSGMTGLPANSAIVSGLTQGTIGAGVGGLSALAGGGDVWKGAVTGGLTGGLTGGIGQAVGYNFLPQGSAAAKYVNPAINRTLTSMAVSGIMGRDVEEAAKNSLMRSAWSTAGKVGGKAAQDLWNQYT